MSESGRNADPQTRPGETSGWDVRLSREIESLVKAAENLSREWRRRFGGDAFRNPPFLKAYQRTIQGHSILSVLAWIHGKVEPDSPGSGSASFERRFQEGIEAAASGHPAPGAVSPDLLQYLERCVHIAKEDQASGLLVDPEPLVRLLKFTNQLADLPDLGAFRVDLLDPFPSRPAEAPAEVADDGSNEAGPAGGQLRPGTRFRQYEIVRLLGTGGFAEVYLAYHTGLREHRAVKAFVSVPLSGPEHDRVRNAFYEEAQTQARLKHENIVRVYEVDDADGRLLLIMEYVEGRTLRSLIDERRRSKSPMSPGEILRIARDVARGLAYAHSQKIIHRDLKPENILLNAAGVAMISDFGLAKSLNDSGQRRTTRLGYLIGTPEYMAPEQVSSDTYDHRIDLYSLGAVLYHLVLGEPPFRAKDAWSVLDKQRKEPPVPLSTLRDDVPADLERIILRLLAKIPEDRYASADEVLQDLESLGRAEGPGKARRRAPIPRWAMAAFLLLLTGGLGFRGFQISRGSATHRQAVPEERSIPTPTTSFLEKDPERKLLDSPSEHSLSPPKPASTPEEPPAPQRPAPDPAGQAVPSLREQFALFPLGEEESAFFSRILDLFTRHRPELVRRDFAPLLQDLGMLHPRSPAGWDARELRAILELVQLADGLVRRRWEDFGESKGELRLRLRDGRTAQGNVVHRDGRSLQLSGTGGESVQVELPDISPEDFLQGSTIGQAEIAFQGLSGDPGRGLLSARELVESQEKALLWIPVFVRLSRLALAEEIRSTIAGAEAPLGGKVPRSTFEKSLPSYPRVAAVLRALEQSEKEILSFFPFLGEEFQEARREGAALELLLGGAFSKVLASEPGTEAAALAAIFVEAEFLGNLESAHDELMAGRGWLRYAWELRPDEKGIPERTQYWDLLEDGGCVLRDSKGPRSLLMGKPHPHAPQGVLVEFEFEPLGPEQAAAEWRFNLRREGGRPGALRFDTKSVSLRTWAADPQGAEETLQAAELPPRSPEPRSHTCALIPGEGLHLYFDGLLAMTLKKEDALLPAQPSFVVRRGKLSVRSIQVLKKSGP